MRDRPAVVVCGTLAYDYLGYYSGSFARFASNEHLNVSMQLDELRTEYGGCAVNICYTMVQLGVDPYPIVRVGRDFSPNYANHLHRLGVDLRGVCIDDSSEHCSQCIVLSDRDGNQITAFHPGPSDLSRSRGPASVKQRHAGDLCLEVGASWAVLAPDVPATMLRQADELNARAIRVLCDPGQGLGDFDSAAAVALLAKSRHLVVNEHEWRRLQTLCGEHLEALIRPMSWVIVTEGAAGCRIFAGGQVQRIPAAQAHRSEDHTGCGDAFRAGLMAGLAQGIELHDCVRIGALAAAINLEVKGCQRHRIDGHEFSARYQVSFGASLPRGFHVHT